MRQLLREKQGAGTHQIAWSGQDDDGRKVARGQYFGRLLVDGNGFTEQQTQKIIMVD